MDEFQPEWDRAVEAFRKSSRPVALTGAGISVESGIPDFRSDTGLWTRFSPEEYATIDVFRRNPERAWTFYRALGQILVDKRPNPAHEALADLEEAGRLEAVVTQNIDGLHQAAGSRNVLEVHGDHRRLHCIECGWKRAVQQSDHAEDEVPVCRRCGYPLKPNVVLFGELVRSMDEIEAVMDACDALLVVGTSAEVHPVAGFPREVARNGGAVFEFDLGRTVLTSTADFAFPGPCAITLPAFSAAVLDRNGK